MKILHTADWHLRADTPRCRLDSDWIETQRRAINEIVKIANSNDAILSIGGDIFHTPTVPARIVNMFLDEIENLSRPACIMAGNHDLPYHSWENVADSSFGTLWAIATGRPSVLRSHSFLGDFIHFGSTLGKSIPGLAYVRDSIDTDLLFLHELVFKSAKDLPPTDKAKTAPELLAEHPGYNFILLGDNHHSWQYKAVITGCQVLNPGCLTRQDASFIDYKPGAWLIDTETLEAKWIPLQADLMSGSVVTDSYLKTQAERETRIAAFVESVQSSGKVSLSFEDNLLQFLKYNEEEIQPGTNSYLTGLIKGEL